MEVIFRYLEEVLFMAVLVMFSIIAAMCPMQMEVGTTLSYDTGDPEMSSILLSTESGAVVALSVPAFDITGYDTGDPKVLTQIRQEKTTSQTYESNGADTKEVSGVFDATFVGK